jgi:autotransporter-associated beta strand protein
VTANGPGGICFGGCTIDTSQPSFDQNSVQAQQGLVIFNGGTFKPTATTTLSAAVLLQSTGGTVNTAATLTTTLSGIINGTGMLTETGNGILVLSGANTYSGGTTVDGGTLVIGADNNLGANGTNLVLNNGTEIDFTNSFSFSHPVTVSGDPTFNVATGATVPFGAAITGAGDIVKTGAGTMQLTAAANNYSGATTVSAGTLEVTGTGAITQSTGLATATKTGSGTVTLTGTNTYTGGTTVSTGTLAIGNSQALGSGTLTLDQGTTLAFTSAVTLANNLAFPQAGDPIIDTGSSSVTLSGSISGIGELAKLGSGTLDLTGSNSYTGATDVRAGTLLVDGSTASSVVSVESGATIGGAGTIGGLVALSGSTVAPGAATPFSTLNVAGNVTLGAGSLYRVQVAANGQTDAILATGTASLSGGTVDVLAASGIYSTSTTYRILTATGGRTGEFNTLNTTSNLAFLSPILTYDSTGLDLAFKKTPVTFPQVAVTANESATATAIEGLGAGNTLYNTVLSQSVAGARQAFDAASGEIHASAPPRRASRTPVWRATPS